MQQNVVRARMIQQSIGSNVALVRSPDHRRGSAVCYQDTSYVYVRVADWLG